MNNRPMPGHAKIDSVTTAPPSRARQDERDDRDHRHQPVLHAVFEQDLHERQTLRRRRAHVVGVQHFLHRCAREARPGGELQQRQARSRAK